MLLEAKLCFVYETEREAIAVAKAISPDNVEVPSGLVIKTMRSGRCISTLVYCEKSFGTFISTLDDFLACVSVVEKTLETIKSRA